MTVLPTVRSAPRITLERTFFTIVLLRLVPVYWSFGYDELRRTNNACQHARSVYTPQAYRRPRLAWLNWRSLPPTWQPCLKRPLRKPLFHISGEVFKPAQGSHFDLHMATFWIWGGRQADPVTLRAGDPRSILKAPI